MLNKKYLFSFLIFFIFLLKINSFTYNAAFDYIKKVYIGKYTKIKDMVIDYEFRAQDVSKDSKKIAAKEEDIPLIGKGKIFYKEPYYLRIETEFVYHSSLEGVILITIKDGEYTVILKNDAPYPLNISKDNRYPLIVNFPFFPLLRYPEVEKILYPVVVGYEQIGTGQEKGKNLVVISFIDTSKMYERYRMYLDPNNYLPAKFIFYPFSKEQTGIEVVYKGISYINDGRPFPTKILIYNFSYDNPNNKKLAWVLYLENISVNVGLSDDLFDTSVREKRPSEDIFIPPQYKQNK
ncbi:MAG: outer membrane lipoprotein-sorting protein [bacterium]|nr:outer membrane lipoprotein-sorting protein [bacterium]